MNQLQGKGSPIPDPQESVGALYQPRLDIMCEAYQKYCDRLLCALNLLQHLQEYPEFRHFLKVRRRPNKRRLLNCYKISVHLFSRFGLIFICMCNFFSIFLQKTSSCEFSLESFLNKPVKHFQLLMAHFSKILQIVPDSHHDYEALRSIVNGKKG